jgi:hypothetical protein
MDKRGMANYINTVIRPGLILRRRPAGEGAFTAPPGGQAVKELMTSCYKAIIEGQGRYVSGWTPTGTLQLADGSEIAMTPLDKQQQLRGKIWRVARLKRGNTDWLIDGVNLSYALNRPGALPHRPKTQHYHALRMLSEMLNVRLVSGYPNLWSNIGTKELQSAVEKKALRLEKLRSVVAVAFTDSHMTRGLAPFYVPTTNIFKRHEGRMSQAPPTYIPILLTRFDFLAAPKLQQIKSPEVNETILWHFQQQIQDKLDIRLKSAPSASQVFVLCCRDRMKLADIHRKHDWPVRTLKLRKAMLRKFLGESGLTLEMFFVDRSIFAAAERQLRDYRGKRISPTAAGEMDDATESE